MRSYGQYCSIAKALDAIGDRWNLLIVRELLLRGRCRYTDLLHGLPGIATNLLADRLRELERGGIITREEAPPPVATTLFGLTARGEELRPVLRALGQWGVPLMRKPAAGDAFRAHWLALLLDQHLADQAPEGPAVAVELRIDGETTTIETAGGELRTRPGAVERPDLVLSGRPQTVLGVLIGRLTVEDAAARGLEWSGEPAALRRLQRPRAVAGTR